jgi:RNA processing factor Prp31
VLFRSGEDIEEGLAMLEEVLKLIEHSNATYTLKTFEKEGKASVRIKENTPCDGSFNFKLLEQDEYVERRNERFGAHGGNAMQSRLGALEAKIAELELVDEEEKPKSITDKIGAMFLEEPEKIPPMIAAIQSLVYMITGKSQPAQTAAIGSIPDDNDAQINQALEILKQHDDKLGEHLMKLASIAQSDKAAWTMLINMVEKI